MVYQLLFSNTMNSTRRITTKISIKGEKTIKKRITKSGKLSFFRKMKKNNEVEESNWSLEDFPKYLLLFNCGKLTQELCKKIKGKSIKVEMLKRKSR